MSIYRVVYRSMTAFYGPAFIEAESASEAKRKFGKGAFTRDEMALMDARPVSLDEMKRALESHEP